MYILDQHDEHYLRAFSSEMVMACVFNPPLTGHEIHDAEGVYPLDKSELISQCHKEK
ncbi:ectoine synthase [Klebsiella pneumoniae]|uniref:ectoine synthase n=1 Tax=Klebsiella pneumoniae TaxID=573 RepID=UPI001D0EB87E